MLRITKQADHNGPTLLLEGSLVGQWVDLLRSACSKRHPSLSLDLSRVRFVDAAGLQLLRELQRRGIPVRRASGFVTELLKVKP